MAATSPRKRHRTKGRHRKPSNFQASNGAHWLRAGAVGIGVAAAIASGQGIASATPDDSPNPRNQSPSTDDVKSNRASVDAGRHTPAALRRGADNAAADNSSSPGPDRLRLPHKLTPIPRINQNKPGSKRPLASTVPAPPTDATDDDTTDGSEPSDASEGTQPESQSQDPSDAAQSAKAHPHKPSRLATKPRPWVRSEAGAAPSADATPTAKASTPATPLNNVVVTHEAVAKSLAALGLAPTHGNKPTTAASTAAVAATGHPPSETAHTATFKIGAAPVGFHSIVSDVLNGIALGRLGNDVPLPTAPLGELVESLWFAVRPTQFSQAYQRAAAALTNSALAATTLAAAVNDITSTVVNALGLVDNPDGDSAPLTATLYDVAAAEPAAADVAEPTAAATPDNTLFVAVLQRALNRLAGWPGTPHNFVTITNYPIDQALDTADDQLDALFANAPMGSPARWLPDLFDIVHLFASSALPNFSFTDSLNAMGDFLNRVVPPFKIAPGAGALDVISPYKIMAAAVVGVATVLQDMLNGVYDPVQWEIHVIKATVGADVTESDLNNFTALSGKVVVGILADGGAFMHPERAWNVTLPTWTPEQVNPFTTVTYIALIGIYKRFQEMAALTTFMTSTTYESYLYTIGSGSSRSQYAAGSFHAVDPDGNPVTFPAGGSLGATYTSAGGAMVTVNTLDGGYTYTNTLPGTAFFHRATSENEADRYDTVSIPVMSADGVSYTLQFKIQILGGTNSAPTGSYTVGSADGLGVVKGKVTGIDSDGDMMRYSLVGASVNGLSGNSAYTKNGATNGGIVSIDPTTGDFTYVSTATAGASQTFQVQVSDGHGGTTITTVTVPNTTTITPANVNTSTNYEVTGSVPGSTNRPEAFTGYSLGTAPSKGTVTSFDPATGAFTYKSSVGRTTANDDVVTVIATDADGRTVTLRLAVKPAVENNVPTVVVTTSPYSVAQAQNAGGNTLGTWSLNTTTWTQTTTGKLTWSDADNEPLTYAVSTNGLAGKSNNGGNVTLNADGTFTYTVVKNKAYYHAAAIYSPTQVQNAVNGTAPNSATADWFDVTVSDGFTGGTVTQRVYVPIYAVNATPTIAGTMLGAGSITGVGVNDADSEDTYGNFQTVVPSGWNYVGAGGKGINTGTMTRLSGTNTASLTLYDRDGSGNRYYNVDAYGRTTNTQGVTRTW